MRKHDELTGARAIWISYDLDGEPFVVAAFAHPTDAVDFVQRQVRQDGVRQRRAQYFTVRGQTVSIDAFLTPDHAFEWLSVISIWGSFEAQATSAARERAAAAAREDNVGIYDERLIEGFSRYA